MNVQKVKYHYINTKSISQIFIPNFVCVLTNERYKRCQMGFSICHLDHALGVGLGVHGGQQLNSVLPSVRYAIASSIGRNPTKSGVCVTQMNGACNSTFI